MKYSKQDLKQLKQAYLDLMMGKRLVRVTVMGQTTEWAQPNADKLRELIAEVEVSRGMKSSHRILLAQTSKGL